MNADLFVRMNLGRTTNQFVKSNVHEKFFLVSDMIGNHDVIETGRSRFVCNTIEKFKSVIKETSTKRLIVVSFEDMQKEHNTVIMSEKYTKLYREGVQHELIRVVFFTFPCVHGYVNTTAREAVAV